MFSQTRGREIVCLERFPLERLFSQTRVRVLFTKANNWGNAQTSDCLLGKQLEHFPLENAKTEDCLLRKQLEQTIGVFCYNQ